MTKQHFVIIAGRSSDTGSHICLVTANTPAEAHQMAADEYRKQHGLATSVHISTATAHKGTDEEDATVYYYKLLDRIDEEARKRREADEPS